MSNAIMLSIHHIHAERIFKGEKTFEIRKTAPSCAPSIVYMYDTKSGDGVGAVVGEFKCNAILKTNAFSYGADEPTAEKYREYIAERACLTVDNLLEYANGGDIYAFVITDVIRYPKSIPLVHFGINRAPQSWQYVK